MYHGMMNDRPLHIGLVFGYGLAYYREILRGIMSFAEARPRWIFTPIAPDPEAVRAVRPLAHDGYIAHIFTPGMGKALARLRKPVVNVSGVLPRLAIPRVGVDHEAAGCQAADHLLDRGLRHFGFFGYPDHAYSIGREEGFRLRVEAAGYRVESYYAPNPSNIDPTGLWRWDDELQRWLSGLGRPVGILASNDVQGVQLSEACRQEGLRVPDEVALVGVDNDDLLCEMSRPSLSSVALPGERIGHEAARLLDLLMTVPESIDQIPSLRLPPLGVMTRGSSDMLAIGDVDVTAAVRFIRSHSHEPIRVVDVLDVITVSRRSLERRFRAALGRGIGEEIRRSHMERAKGLLSETEMPISLVATNSGFSEPKQLSAVFRQEMEMTPTEYRRRSRAR